ncbi:MAG: glycosidase [Thiohalocapsa sp.]
MSTESEPVKQSLPNGVMLNAYPDSVGGRLSDLVNLLKRPELEGAFSLLYILPTFFNSDLDRGFSIIDYGLNRDLVSPQDLHDLDELGVMFKFDLILNHLSVASPQFRDLLEHGDDSEYRDFFVDWNAFWAAYGDPDDDGCVIPHEEHLQKLFMRKPGLPVLKVGFPDGSARPYWNTFYQQVSYRPVSAQALTSIDGVTEQTATQIASVVNTAIETGTDIEHMDLDGFAYLRDQIRPILEHNRDYLGQMDLNAGSEKVWTFYDQTLRQLRAYGAKIIRLDAFAYLHKQPGEPNFFNKPGTWDYLERLKGIAAKYDLIIFPEVHAEYGKGLHTEVAEKGFPIYDFFFPGLVIDALERGTNGHLLHWINEVTSQGLETINMLGCHDGIPVLDLRGAEVDGVQRPGLLDDAEIEAVMDRIIERGGRVKNLYGPDGKKISYYQVNATFYSALGEDDRKMLLARAIQLFMPGIPQVWYLDLFAGSNDYAAADNGGAAGHKEINRTNLSNDAIAERLTWPVVRDQLALIALRNGSVAFNGKMVIKPTEPHRLHVRWEHQGCTATLQADLRTHSFSVTQRDAVGAETLISHLWDDCGGT